MGRYSQYGLDDDKKARDEGEAGRGFCVSCDTIDYKMSDGTGFSMCFSNWIVCQPCAEKANAAEGPQLQEGECLKCKSTTLKGLPLQETGYILCKACALWAVESLKKRERVACNLPDPGKQIKLFD